VSLVLKNSHGILHYGPYVRTTYKTGTVVVSVINDLLHRSHTKRAETQSYRDIVAISYI